MEALLPSQSTSPTSIKSCFAQFFFPITEARPVVDTVKVWFQGEVSGHMPASRRVTLADGVRFFHDGFHGCKAEAELPKLLWGHNGHLLTNQAELDDSVARFRLILSQYVKFQCWHWVLIDLVWQFDTRAEDVILAHQWLRFPGVRSLPSLLCGGKEISWRGGRRGLKFYRKAENVLRVEMRLAGKKLRERISDDAPLNFAELYGAFRAEVQQLPQVQLPDARKHSMAEIVATLPMDTQNTAILAYQIGRTARAVSGFKRDVSLARVNRTGWNLRDLLPAQSPPPPVNVEPKRRRRA
jgi:hypothetical protein